MFDLGLKQSSRHSVIDPPCHQTNDLNRNLVQRVLLPNTKFLCFIIEYNVAIFTSRKQGEQKTIVY